MPGLDPATPLRGLLGDRTAKALASGLDLHTADDLLRHYPRRYADRGELTDLAALAVGEHVTVLAEVTRVSQRRMKQRRGALLEVVVGDGRGSLTLTFFNQPWRERELRVGRRGLFSGKVSAFRDTRQLAHPEYLLLADADTDGGEADSDAAEAAAAFAAALIPVYPASAALPSWRVAQCVAVLLDGLDDLPDPLPGDLRAERDLPDLVSALRAVHRPLTRADAERGRHRLAFEEAYLLQVELGRRRARWAATPAVARPARADGLRAAFDAALPFTLTSGQREVGEQLAADLAATHPMHRLLQGEVGSGKTVVALGAMLTVVDTGGQAVLLAPTEVLAAQHARTIGALLGPLGTRGQLGASDQATSVALVTGSLGAAARRGALAAVASGQAGIVVGTHALLEAGVDYADLGLVVVDEQHRFGVEQRAALTARGPQPPHVLVMTATPIPRTVAMTVFGDLEVSTLVELPAGRADITTHVVPTADKPHFLDRAWQRVREEVGSGRQAFVVCPRIGEADAESAPADGGGGDLPDEDPEVGGEASRPPTAAVAALAPALAAGPLAGLRLDVLHGQLGSEAKDAAMAAFVAGRTDVLVATTVVEVGVDVPNASVMVVMDADRFGVSQLHQLRGRVGRGAHPGLCLLVTSAPAGSPARERLEAVAATRDGFELAQVDLLTRREGDVLGAAQSGRRSSLRLLSVLRDEALITQARADAEALLGSDPTLADHPVLAAALAALASGDQADYLEKV